MHDVFPSGVTLQDIQEEFRRKAERQSNDDVIRVGRSYAYQYRVQLQIWPPSLKRIWRVYSPLLDEEYRIPGADSIVYRVVDGKLEQQKKEITDVLVEREARRVFDDTQLSFLLPSISRY
ncbi:MAG: hypothetical protein ACK4VI_04955 [Alphaproteobacteria bacterium]